MSTGSEHTLLLRHFDAWATAKHLPMSRDLLGKLLELRFDYDDQEPTYWPAGSVEDLLVRLWPAKGDVETPPEEAVVNTLDAYFRFLRSTGRMSARSSSPAELRKETRRSVRRMAAAAADQSAWSPTKALIHYGRSMGMEFDDLPDAATLQSRLEQVTASWNALPIHERQRLMPHPGDERQSGCERAMGAYGTDDPIDALLMSFSPELPSGELPKPEAVAPLVESSPFMHRLIAVCQWIGDRVEVTSTGVLRPAAAHEVYDALGLSVWTEQQLRQEYEHYQPPAMRRMGADAWIAHQLQEPWRNAADCEALDRLWRGAVACGVVELRGRYAYARFPLVADAEEWTRMGLRAVIRLLEDFCVYPGRAGGLVYGLLRSYVLSCAPVPTEEILTFARDWEVSAEEQSLYDSLGYDRRPSDRSRLARGCGALADTGVFVEGEHTLQLTPFGDIAVTGWLKFRERRET